MSPPKKFLLIDASSFIYRAYHAFPPLETRSGEPVGAIFGFLTLLRSLLQRLDPDACLIAFDPKGGSYRKKLFEAYKQHRIEMPHLLKNQMQGILDILSFSGLKTYVAPGFEADDLIACAIRQYADPQIQFIIASVDKDMAQLVDDPGVVLLQDKEAPALDVQKVVEKYGVMPRQIPDYLALLGDSSDNIPGVNGIGKKTAEQLLQHFHSIEDLYDHLDRLETIDLRGKEKIKRLLQEGEASARLSKTLAQLHCDLSLPFDIDALGIALPNFEKLIDTFEYYKFHTFLKEARQFRFGARQFSPQTSPLSLDDKPLSLPILQSNSAIEPEKVTMLSPNAWFESLHALKGDRLPLVVCLTEHGGMEDFPWILLFNRSFTFISTQWLEQEAHHREWEHFLRSPSYLKITRSARQFLGSFPHAQMVSDSAYSFHLLYPMETAKPPHQLWERFFPHHNRHALASVDPALQAAEHALLIDAIQLRILEEWLIQRLEEISPKLLNVLYQVEIPLISVLHRMEKEGIALDCPQLQEVEKQLKAQSETLQEQIYLLSGEEFNLASSKQVQEMLFDRLQLPSKVKTQKGQRSTREEALSALADDYPIAALLLKHREVSKLRSTYAHGLLREVSQDDRRLHTHYQQLVTSTGRLSSTAPNLQNIPIKTTAGKAIRRCFIAPKGHQLLSADYSQVELRILAHFSQDEALLQSFKNHDDIHQLTAAAIHSKLPSEISSEQRRQAKTIVFGLIYGMSAFGLAKELKVSRREAQHYLEHYFFRYPGVKHYLDATRQHVLDYGWVETLLGRRWLAPKLKHSKSLAQDANLRAAINAPIQGTAAELIKVAMINIDQWIQSLGPNAGIRMLLQVHDELLFEIADDRLTEYQPIIVTLMQQALELTVPLLVNIGIGTNWTQAH